MYLRFCMGAKNHKSQLIFKIKNMKFSTNFKKLSNDKLILLSSIATFIYFMSLVALSHYEIDIIVLGVFIELLTIPFILLLLFLAFLSIKNTIKSKFNIKSNYFISFLLLGLTIIILIVATI